MMINFQIETYFKYVDVNYFVVRDCEHFGCDQICRCGRVEDLHIEDVDKISLDSLLIMSDTGKNGRKVRHNLSVVEKYCLIRLMSIHGCWNKEEYSAWAVRGYYGEEVEVSFDNEISFINDIKKMLTMKKDIDKVKFVINLEYSFLLDRIKPTTKVSVEEFDFDLILKNNEHFERAKNDNIHGYQWFYDTKKDKTFPIGIIIGDRLIDGYHRTQLKIKDGFKKGNYLVLS